MTFSDKAIKYYSNIKAPENLPDDIKIINPYSNPEVLLCIKNFYEKFFNDNNKRIFIWGINPGRFGGGITGISFTDPVALREQCEIDNNLGNKKELSGSFIYDMINSYGGTREFFNSCCLTALYPLAIVKGSTNYNYYDEPALYGLLRGEIVSSIKTQVDFGADRSFSVCLGKKNYKYFKELNDEYNFFERIEILEHPHYIMQYKLKKKEEYINKYISCIKNKK